jgi:adenine/guanine/hypoxanthine permease
MSTATTDAGVRNGFDRYFEITARGSSLGQEIRGGFATFFTMAYIVVLNPLILGAGSCRSRRSRRAPRWWPA